MIYDKIKFFSLFGKRITKFNNNLKIKKKNKNSSFNRVIDSYLDKNCFDMKLEYQKNKEKDLLNSFIQKIYDSQKKEKEIYSNKLKVFKSIEEEKYMFEIKRKRFENIINLKKRRECFESEKLYPNYNELSSSILKIEKKIDQNKIESFTERNNKREFNNKINNSILLIKSNKEFKSIETNNLNRPNINSSLFRNKNNNMLLSPRISQFHLFNKKLKRHKISLLSPEKKYEKIEKKFFSLNDSSFLDNRKIKKLNILSQNISLSHSSLSRREKEKSIEKNIKNPKVKLFKYKKKWNVPKSILFDKILGRYDKKDTKDKIINLDGDKSYSPNYNSIFVDNNKSFVNYGKNKEMELRNLKINKTRKLISNQKHLINSPSNSYIVMDIINKDNIKKKELKINDLKKKFGNYYEIIKKIKK